MTACARAERFCENPFSRRDPTGRAIEDAPLGAAEPAQFCRPKRSAQHAAGLRVDFSFIEFAAQLCRIWRAPRIGPGKHRCDWPVVSVNAKETVPERGSARRDDGNSAQRRRIVPRFECFPEATRERASKQQWRKL